MPSAVGRCVGFAAPSSTSSWRVVTLDADFADTAARVAGAVVAHRAAGASSSALATGVLGTGLAWLLVRTDVPFARVWRVLAPLPLVFPSFVGAAAFIAGLAPDGVLREALELVGYHAPRRFRGLGASCLVLTAFTYPYVYLPVAARLAGAAAVDRGERPPARRPAGAAVLPGRAAAASAARCSAGC